MFPQQFIDKVKESVDLVKLVSEYTELKKIGPYVYQGHCPHPDHGDSTPSFRVFLKGYKSETRINTYDTWACMGCHYGRKTNTTKDKVFGSDCIAFIQWIENKNWKESIIYLANKYQIPIPTDKNEKLYKNNKALAYSYMDNLNSVPLTYLKNRGLSEEDCFDWGIGFDGQKIIFPLLDRYKNVLGFTKRWIEVPEGANDKYKNSPNNPVFNKSMYLYGIHNLDENFKEIRITEGSMDVILAHKYGAKNVVATLGTAFTEGHMEIIKHYGLTPVFCMDGDPAGLKAINKAITLLAEHNIYCKILILPLSKDLADIAIELGENIEDYISNNAVTYGNYLIKDEVGLYLSQVNELKLRHYPNLIKILDKVPTQEEKNILKSYVKDIMHIDL